MNKFFKLVLNVAGLSLLFLGLCLAPSLLGNFSGYGGLEAFFIGLIVMGLALFLQFVAGIGLSVGKKRKELGKALLLSCGILLLIGVSVCGGAGILG